MRQCGKRHARTVGKSEGLGEPLQTLFGVGSLAGLTDGQLLERFVEGRGEAAEAAFTALVERHGPMVLGVCRAVTGRPARRRRRVSGHVPGPGAAGRIDPAGGRGGELAL